MAYLPISRASFRASNTGTRRRGLMEYLSLFRQRQALSRLDAHQLRDIGLTENDARIEAERPIWDAPSHWR